MPFPRLQSLLSLPTEILAEVLTYLTYTDIKSFRLVCKRIKSSASPVLFRTFTLYPHTESLFRLQELARSTSLACCIQKIIYQCQFLGLVNGALNHAYTLFETPPWDRVALEPWVQRLVEQSMHFDSLVDQLELVVSLQQILLCFPNLTTITVLEHMPAALLAREPLTELPSFYSRMLGDPLCRQIQGLISDEYHGESSYDQGSAMAMLFSISFLARPLKTFELLTSKFGWLDPNSRFGKFSRCNQALAALDELNLSYRGDIFDLETCHTSHLQAMLKQANNLSKLILIMGSVRENEQIAELEAGLKYVVHHSGFVSGSTFCSSDNSPALTLDPRLACSDRIRKLEIGGLKCKGCQLKSVLGYHAKALQDLRFSDLVLLKSQWREDSPRPCLVDFIKWLQTDLNLSKVSFAGTMTNCGLQHWIINEEGEFPAKSLYQRVTNFVVNGGECPLDFTKIPTGYYDLGQKKGDHLDGVNMDGIPWFLGYGEFKGDPSWQMKYYHIGRESVGSGDPEVEFDPDRISEDIWDDGFSDNNDGDDDDMDDDDMDDDDSDEDMDDDDSENSSTAPY